MERFPEEWLWEPLDGVHAYRYVPYIWVNDDDNDDYYYNDKNNAHSNAKKGGSNGNHGHRQAYKCLLCETGIMKSEQMCRQHVRGSKHKRLYQILKIQQQVFWLDQRVSSIHDHQSGSSSDNPYAMATEDHCDLCETGTLSLLSYIMPFRRWQYGQWRAGMSCQLCGTAALPTRLAVAQHCQGSKRHALLRMSTYMDLHGECRALIPRLHSLKEVAPMFAWHMERKLIHYVAAKEQSFAGLASHTYEWYQVLRALETFELRIQMVYLELAIWKQGMIRRQHECQEESSLKDLCSDLQAEGDNEKDGHGRKHDEVSTNFATSLDQVYNGFGKPEELERFKQTMRVTCGIPEIIQAVIPFLRNFPAL